MITSLTILNNKNEALHGTLRQNNTTKPLLIICHGYGTSRKHPALAAISESLYHRGHNTFTFDFSESAQKTSLAQQVADIESVIAHFTNYQEITLIGGSFGALSTAIATIRVKRVTRLITVNGFFGTPHLGKEGLKIYILFILAALVVPRHKKSWHFLKQAY